MALQRLPISTSNTIEKGSGPNTRTPTSDESMTLNIVEGRPSDEKVELDEASPVVSAPGADDYPDGGLAAWCVVVGVSSFPFPRVLEFADEVGSRSLCVPSSQRRLHSRSLALNCRLTSDHPRRFGLVNAWGVRAFQTLLLVGPKTNRRNRYSRLIMNEFSYRRPQPRRCECRIQFITLALWSSI